MSKLCSVFVSTSYRNSPILCQKKAIAVTIQQVLAYLKLRWSGVGRPAHENHHFTAYYDHVKCR